jgi:dsRNA-specific ribonuclease
LKALCATHDTEEKYTLTKEVGPTHAKEFEITCSLGGVRTVGKGKTKKNAKKEAAAKMMEKLAGRPEDVHPLEWVIFQPLFKKLKYF